jgi:hypothetical protein
VIFGGSLIHHRADRKGLHRSSGVRHLVPAKRRCSYISLRLIRLSTKRTRQGFLLFVKQDLSTLRPPQTGTHRTAPAASIIERLSASGDGTIVQSHWQSNKLWPDIKSKTSQVLFRRP